MLNKFFVWLHYTEYRLQKRDLSNLFLRLESLLKVLCFLSSKKKINGSNFLLKKSFV